MQIHKEGYKILLPLTFVFIIALIILYYLVSPLWIFLTICACCVLVLLLLAFFFRCARRRIVLDDNAVIAPADGRIVHVDKVCEGEYFNEERLRLSIFMSLTDIHVNWYPVSGEITYFQHHQGNYWVAWHPKSSEKNEHTTIVIKHGKTEILLRQIAGYVARRIVSYAMVGKKIQQCSELGIIRFGSRVDIFLPLDCTVLVSKGQKVRAQRTVLARLVQTE